MWWRNFALFAWVSQQPVSIKNMDDLHQAHTFQPATGTREGQELQGIGTLVQSKKNLCSRNRRIRSLSILSRLYIYSEISFIYLPRCKKVQR